MSNSTRTSRFMRMSALAVVAGVAALATPAGALPPPGNDPPEPPERPDLTVSALSVVPSGSSWSIGYSVRNGGTKAAPSSTLGLNGGPGLVSTKSVPSLAVGATASGTVLLPRTAECFAHMFVTADSARVITESSETNNTRQSVGTLPGCPPRYKVTAYQFKALDESGPDWSGSDEPFWIFNSVSTGGTALSTRSQVYGDVDTGETRFLANQCIFGCGGSGALAPLGIGLSVQAWEEDGGNVDSVYYDVADAFDDVGGILAEAKLGDWLEKAGEAMTSVVRYILDWYANDLLGKSDFGYAPEYLAQALPAPGRSFSDTRILGDSSTGASYSLDLTVQRIV